MLDITKLDSYVLNILEKQGWYPGRTYDISRWLNLLSQEGYVCFDYAEQVLRSLGGISVSDAGDKDHMCAQFCFNALEASGEFDRIEDFQEIANEELYPIGLFFQSFAYVGKSRSVYWGDWRDFYWAGNSIEDYLNNMFDRKVSPKLLYTNPNVDGVAQKQKEMIEQLRLKYPNNKIIG